MWWIGRLHIHVAVAEKRKTIVEVTFADGDGSGELAQGPRLADNAICTLHTAKYTKSWSSAESILPVRGGRI
jgi:hypothetical protein